MKVYIGPYRDYDEEHNEWRPTEPFERDIRINIDDYDVWDMYTTLARIIHPMLVRLKEIKGGHPCMQEMVETAPCASGQECNCWEEWNTVLDKMIWSFKQMIDDTEEEQYYSGDIVYEDKMIPKNDAGEVVPEEEVVWWEAVRSPDHTFKVDYEGLKKHHERIQEGLDLFSKHYMDLWD